MRYYTESHEWLSVDGSQGTVGITDHAQKELGLIVHIELPKVGDLIKAGEAACVLESTKAAVDVYAPVSGRVAAINEALRMDSSSVNRSAEKNGWLFKLDLADLGEIKKLLTISQYEGSVLSKN